MMFKKYQLISVVFCLAAMALAFHYFEPKQTHISESESMDLQENGLSNSETKQATQEFQSSPKLADDLVQPELDAVAEELETELVLLQNEQLADTKKQQIDDLILEYDQNLSSPEQRKLLQTEINNLMDEYNRLILPVALAKMNREE